MDVALQADRIIQMKDGRIASDVARAPQLEEVAT
jgi:hypothetical protein